MMDMGHIVQDTQEIKALFYQYAPKMALALIVFGIGWMAIKLVHNFTGRYADRIRMDATVKPFLLGLLNAILRVVLVISVLGILGVQTSSFITVLGAAGLAIGLALKDNLSNFASGIFLLIYKQAEVGNYVITEGGEGTVDSISLFQTVLVRADQSVVYVPNSKLVSGSVTNFSKKPLRRNDLKLRIGPSADIDFVKSTLRQLVIEEKRILAQPEAEIFVSHLLESSVEMTVRYWVKAGDFWPVIYDFTEKAKKVLDEEKGISLTPPKLHFFKEMARKKE